MSYSMISPRCLRLLLTLVFGTTVSLSGFGQDAAKPVPDKPTPDKAADKPTPELPPLPDLTFSANSTAEALEKVIASAKTIRPRSAEQYSAMQTAIRDASKQLMTVLKDNNLPRYKQAQLDSMSASLLLATFFGEDARAKVVEQLKQMLKERETLSMEDVQMATFAAANLELNPNKKDARDVYALLDGLLTDDKREEMQNLRINLQSSIRRIDLLGNKFELEYKDIRDKLVKTEDFAGKFVIVDFFASWCQPCLSEVPRLKKYAAKYKEKGLEVLAVSLDDTREALDKYLSEAELPWQVIHDDASNPLDRLQLKFGIAALPTVLLLNKEGTVISLEARGAELDRLMEMLFEAPTLADPPPGGNNPADKSTDRAAGKVEANPKTPSGQNASKAAAK
jgi:thiol-disulfide isomerase/thioredoxin